MRARYALPILLGALACVLLAIWGFFAPHTVLRGWLAAFVFASGLSFGALALLCIGRLTGGGWVAAAAPILRKAAGATPFHCLSVLPILYGAAILYPWVDHPDTAGPGVAALYLNLPLFGARSGLALIGLSLFALAVLRGGGRLVAALGLIFFAVVVDYAAVDWILSLSPRFSSSAFGAQIAIQNILSALALALLFPATWRAIDGASQDLAGLALATALGGLYMAGMSLLINWYGDQPARAAWYLDRVADAGAALAIGAFLFGAAGPILALLFSRVRGSPALLRPVGAALLIGIALHDCWLVEIGREPLALVAALGALVAMGALAARFSSWALLGLSSKETEDVA